MSHLDVGAGNLIERVQGQTAAKVFGYLQIVIPVERWIGPLASHLLSIFLTIFLLFFGAERAWCRRR